MASDAKIRFLKTFHNRILAPRNLDFRVQFPGPTGTNAVEAALKTARLATRRSGVVYFSNAFHGMTLGSLAVTANVDKRAGAGLPLTHSTCLPYGATDRPSDVDEGLTMLRQLLVTTGNGLDTPAAVIVETVQGEGGINVASDTWLREVRSLCTEAGVVLIVDDVQMGCGRTGSFFSFESAGIVPDIITLSKSISGYGLPMALVLLRPDLDVFTPGQHNGTFRGNNHAFVTATAALDTYWADDGFEMQVARKADRLVQGLRRQISAEAVSSIRGRGLAQGLVFSEPATAERVARTLFNNGLLAETCGAQNQVLKLLPPLTITDQEIDQGVDAISCAISVA